MAHKWTPDDEARLTELLTVEGYTYGTATDRLVSEGVSVTTASVRQKAQAMGINPGKRPAERPEPETVLIPTGIKGGERFQRLKIPVKAGDRILVIGDAQIPYQDAATFAAIERFTDDFEPNVIIWDGDMFDFYNLSKYDQNPGRASNLQHELDTGAKIMERWAHRHPNAERVLIMGNHEDRIRRFVWEHHGLASLRALDPDQLLSAGGSWRVLPYGSQVHINDLVIEHGDSVRSKAGMSAWAMFQKRGMSGIMGHTHRFGVISHRNARGQHLYIENGCTCRLDAEYAPNPDWTQAFTYGFVNNGSIHLNPTRVLVDGFRAEARFYKRDH